jgi:two-component system, OmpR family, sensor histidine kinase KdpD
MATIEDGVDRLDALLTNLLDLSRLQSGAVRPRRDEVAIADVVSRAVTGLPQGTVRIDIPDELPAVVADAGLLERVLANIMENAVRHTTPGAPVRVLAFAANDAVRVCVADSGPGVADAQKERMFDAFQRLGDAPQGDGLGLGLAVARGLTHAQNGVLEAEDTPGGGLTMVVTLPAVAPGPSPLLEPSAETAS